MNKRLFTTLLFGIYLVAGPHLWGQVRTDSNNKKKVSASDEGRRKSEQQEKAIGYEDDPSPEGTQVVLWREPVDIEKRDLFHGNGDREGAPDTSARFVFIRRDKSGSKKKIEVEDAQNRKWTVKFGSEARSEVTATRIVWAVGFHVDQNYFVKKAHVEGLDVVLVENVRFERDDDGYETIDNWSWSSNPFVGTRELDGLKTLMALLNNYDLKNENTKIVRPDKWRRGETNRLIYYVNDLGATLGSTGMWVTTLPIVGRLAAGTKGTAEDFANHRFITGVRNGEVVFHYKRRNALSVLSGVKAENARWMGNLLSRLSDRQLMDAFRAGGFDSRETAIFLRAIRERIAQLKELSGE
jgi:hypothetical protein